MTQTETISKMLCAWCDKQLEGEEIENPNICDGETLCDDCYDDWRSENESLCCCCQEGFLSDEIGHPGQLIASVDYDATDLQDGLWQILDLPLYCSPLIGGGFFFKDSVAFIRRLPLRIDTDGYPCGYLCQKCSDKWLAEGDGA
jgi:hypothetical protein